MRHDRHYTLEEARALRSWVTEQLESMRAARVGLSDQQSREALTGAAPTNGGGVPGKAVGEAFVALRAALSALQSREIVLRDLDRGLLDFPSIIDGEEVYLCWVQQEEPDITTWHGLDDGYQGRQPL